MTRAKKRQDRGKPQSEKGVREITPAEDEAMRKHLARIEEPSVRFTKPTEGSDLRARVDHPNELIGQCLLADALGSANNDFVNGLAAQLVIASQRGEVDLRKLNFKLAVIKESKPRDQFESMLVAEMVEMHVAIMSVAHQLDNVPVAQLDSIASAFNKLARTFVMQMDGLKRYRSDVGENLTVQHVSVSDGGQAIVGNVTQLTREQRQEKIAAQLPASSDTKVVPMPRLDENKEHDIQYRRRAVR
jgi:hypothetical protein